MCVSSGKHARSSELVAPAVLGKVSNWALGRRRNPGQQFKDPGQLAELVLARQQRAAHQQLAKDAVDAPEVDGEAAGGGAQQQLGRAAPQRDPAVT